MADKDLRPQKNETITINPKDHRYYYPQINPQEKNHINDDDFFHPYEFGGQTFNGNLNLPQNNVIENANYFQPEKYNKEKYNKEYYQEKKAERHNNKIMYSLISSYYKDVELCYNYKSKKNKNREKNFLRKNRIQDISNSFNNKNETQNNFPPSNFNNNFLNNMNNMNNMNKTFHQEDIFNEQNALQKYYNLINQGKSNNCQGNPFNITNQQNYYLTNNINNFNYNFSLNEKKNNKRNKEREINYFFINLDNILKGIDRRTTVMIRHIPNKYSYKDLLEEINIKFRNKFDFFYLPLDSQNNCNLGYAFINFIDSLHIISFYHEFKSRKWPRYNSYKECDLTFAKFQGKHELTSNIEKNWGKNADKRKMPMIFDIYIAPKIDLLKQYYLVIKKYRPEMLSVINWN